MSDELALIVAPLPPSPGSDRDGDEPPGVWAGYGASHQFCDEAAETGTVFILQVVNHGAGHHPQPIPTPSPGYRPGPPSAKPAWADWREWLMAALATADDGAGAGAADRTDETVRILGRHDGSAHDTRIGKQKTLE